MLVNPGYYDNVQCPINGTSFLQHSFSLGMESPVLSQSFSLQDVWANTAFIPQERFQGSVLDANVSFVREEQSQGWLNSFVPSWLRCFGAALASYFRGGTEELPIINDLEEFLSELNTKFLSLAQRVDWMRSDARFLPQNDVVVKSVLDLIEVLEQDREDFRRLMERHPSILSSSGDVMSWLADVERLRYHYEELTTQSEMIRKRLDKRLEAGIKGLEAEQLRKEYSLRQLQLFLEVSSETVDDHLFLHVLGDRFGRWTLLEGDNWVRMLLYRTSVLMAKLKTLEIKNVCSDEDRLCFCREIFSDSELAKDLAESPDIDVFIRLGRQLDIALEIFDYFQNRSGKQFQQVMQKHMASLESGGSFFFLGGWVGHGVVYEVRKQDNDKYTFRIYTLA